MAKTTKPSTKKTATQAPSAEIAIVGTEKTIAAPLNRNELPEKISELKKMKESLLSSFDPKISTDITVDQTVLGLEVGKISEITKISSLVKVRSYVRKFYETFEEDAKALDVHGKVKLPLVSGLTLDQWTEVLKKRVAEIANKTKIDTIDQTIKNFEDLLSTDQKLAKSLQEAAEKASSLYE